MLGLLCATLFAFAPQTPPASQDLVLENASVFTGADAKWTGPLVVVGGKIQAIGTAPPVGATAIDLKGAFVCPGLEDAHGHLLGLGTAMETVDLVGTKSFDEVIARVKAAAAKVPPHNWILGRGWDQNRWREKDMPNHADLSAEVPDHPVWLVRIDGHAGLLNLEGLFTAGIVKDTRPPAGGEILKNENGDPTGVLVDRAMELVNTPEPSTEDVQRRLLLAQEECLRHGLTCVHDAGVDHHLVDTLKLLHKSGKWRLRVYALLSADQREAIRKGPWQSNDGLLVVRAVKGYADGALGSRGAALLEPYSDRSGFKGLMLTPEKGLQDLAQLCADKGMQLCVHAIGDAANRAVLDAYAHTRFPSGAAAARFRIEHCQVVAPVDVPRFKELGVIPSMQPTHLTSDMPWAPERLGPERTQSAYAWQAFLGLGLPLAFGSDFPVESVDPRKGLFAAVTTRSESGGPPAGWRPEQKLDIATALRCFTKDAAYARFAEQELGTIEAGKRADLTVFDRDLTTCPPEQLLTAKVLLTVVDGRVVFRAEGH